MFFFTNPKYRVETLNNRGAYMSVSISSAYGRVPTAGAKLYVPVSNSSLLYSHFDHVSGFKAAKGQKGVSISKLQILNTLIDHLSSVKSGKVPKALKAETPEQIDSLIENYQKQIRQTIQANESQLYGLAGARPEAGVLFSFDA